MGKSKKVRTADVMILKAYVQRRKASKILTVVFGVLFFLCCMFLGGFGLPMWPTWVFLALYIIAFVSLRICSRCPYCGNSIMSKFDSTNYCPRCHRPIKPNVGMGKPKNTL